MRTTKDFLGDDDLQEIDGPEVAQSWWPAEKAR